jgi:PAS domain S-box-containing protein
MDAQLEIRRLRRALRDLVALSTIPAALVGRDPPALVAGLADVLVGGFYLDFAYVRLRDPDGGPAIEVTRGEAWPGFPEWLQQRFSDEAALLSRPEIVPVVGNGDRSFRGVVIPVGVNAETGLVVAACDRAEFPDETDQLLLSVAANHAAAAFQTARLLEAHSRTEEALSRARDELERRVAERTVELRRTTTEALATQQRFRDLVNSVGGIVWEADAETFAFSFVSEQAERILGYPPEQWLTEPTFWRDHVHPDDRESAVQLGQQAGAEPRGYDSEYRMLAADGRVVWLRGLVTLVVEGGRPARLRGVMVDITESKRTDEARRWITESLDRVSRAVQGTNDLEQMMSDVLNATLEIFDCDRAWLVYPCDPDAAWHGVKMQRTRPEFPGLFALGEQVPMEPDTADVFRTVRAARGAVQFGPKSDLPLSTRLAERLGTQSRMVMALYPKGDQPYMFGISQCAYARLWARQEQFLFEGIGRRLEDALTSLSIFHRLRESEERYRTIFESARVSIWEQDFSRAKAAIDDLKAQGVRDFRAYFAAHRDVVRRLDGLVRVLDVNDATVKLFGAGSKTELLASLDRLQTPDSRATFVDVLVDIAEGRTYREGEIVVQNLEGQRVNVLFTISFPPAATGFARLLITMIDVTRRQRAEHLAAQVFESSPDRVAIFGRDYRLRRVNPVFERHWGIPAARAVGLTVADVVGQDMFEQTFRPHFERCFAGEEVSFTAWIPYPSGRRYMALTYTPLRLGSDDVGAVLMISRDLTDHMLAVEALQQAHAELAHVTRVTTLGEMTASIAHEIKQPLAAMVADANASLNWLAAPTPNLERVREALEAIVADGHRADDVTQRIRQLATRSGPQKVPVEVNDVIRDVVPLIGSEVRSHDVDLRLDLTPAPALVAADRVQLQQVVINLALNGIEAMSTAYGRPRELVIRSQRCDGDVVVAVQDAGVGFEPSSVDQLFNAFFTTKPDGMGMGLSISRSIIERHGGRLWATANPRYGATFSFALPVLA